MSMTDPPGEGPTARPAEVAPPIPAAAAGHDRGATNPDALAAEVRALREELAFVRRHRMFVLFQSVPRVLLFRFAAGMAAGLGTVIGATVLLSLIIWAFSQIEFIPIIGEWAVRITEEIQGVLQSAE